MARSSYQPKLPQVLRSAVKIEEGAPTQSVADQEAIKELFPNTYGIPMLKFVPAEKMESKPLNVGVILSGGQAPLSRAWFDQNRSYRNHQYCGTRQLPQR